VRRTKWFSILVEISFQRLNANDGLQFLMFFPLSIEFSGYL